jgi:hypothetical protein
VSEPGMKWAMALSIAAIVASGCAKGDNFEGTGGGSSQGGEPGTGGGTTSGAMGGGGSGAGGSPGPGGSGNTGGDSMSSTGGMSAGGGGSATTTTTTTTTTTSTSTGGGCAANEHECAGDCVGNTPQSGCLQSVACTPCPVPMNGSATCTAGGLCDVSCAVGYTKQGSSCVCANQCCSVADCPAGETCSGGVCSGGGSSSTTTGGGVCDPDECQGLCFVQCFAQMKVGIGTCDANGMCQCQCL